MRNQISDYRFSEEATNNRWNKWLPKKINIFMWRIFKGRLPVKTVLQRLGANIPDITCQSCATEDDDVCCYPPLVCHVGNNTHHSPPLEFALSSRRKSGYAFLKRHLVSQVASSRGKPCHFTRISVFGLYLPFCTIRSSITASGCGVGAVGTAELLSTETGMGGSPLQAFNKLTWNTLWTRAPGGSSSRYATGPMRSRIL
ncbi:hypothetical protein LXL04_011772 [Taraxacum kok-saghyz]